MWALVGEWHKLARRISSSSCWCCIVKALNNQNRMPSLSAGLEVGLGSWRFLLNSGGGLVLFDICRLADQKFWEEDAGCREHGVGWRDLVQSWKPKIVPKFAFSISRISSGIALQTKFPTRVPWNFPLLSFHNFFVYSFSSSFGCICKQVYIHLHLFVHIHNMLQ